MPSELYDPALRDSQYQGNIAKYLVDPHDANACFNFCGGMMFQLSLTQKLRDHLSRVGEGNGQQPMVFDASKPQMSKIPSYSKNAAADNVNIFHGREVRKVANAAGGMGFALQLSHTEDDPEGWTAAEVKGYDGWGHDSQRTWRQADRLRKEGFETFQSKYGAEAFALHHRFYLHFDKKNRLWLSAEDGCEGTPAQV